MSTPDRNLSRRAKYWEKRKELQSKLADARAALLDGKLAPAKRLFLEGREIEHAAQQMEVDLKLTAAPAQVAPVLSQSIQEKYDAVVQGDLIDAATIRAQFQAIAEIERDISGGQPAEADALLPKLLIEKSRQALKGENFDRTDEYLKQIPNRDHDNTDQRGDFEKKIAEEQAATYFMAGGQAQRQFRLRLARDYFRRVSATSSYGPQARDRIRVLTFLIYVLPGAAIVIALLLFLLLTRPNPNNLEASAAAQTAAARAAGGTSATATFAAQATTQSAATQDPIAVAATAGAPQTAQAETAQALQTATAEALQTAEAALGAQTEEAALATQTASAEALALQTEEAALATQTATAEAQAAASATAEAQAALTATAEAQAAASAMAASQTATAQTQLPAPTTVPAPRPTSTRTPTPPTLSMAVQRTSTDGQNRRCINVRIVFPGGYTGDGWTLVAEGFGSAGFNTGGYAALCVSKDHQEFRFTIVPPGGIRVAGNRGIPARGGDSFVAYTSIGR